MGDRSVLVTLEHAGGTAAVYRDGPMAWLTHALEHDVASGITDHTPTKQWIEGGLTVQGGLMARGACAVRVTDAMGEPVEARVAGGAWIVVLDGERIAVCFLDEDGEVVRPAVPDGWQREPVADAVEQCPACGAVNWEQITADDDSRGTFGTSGGEMSPTPFVACTRCGYEVGGGVSYGWTSYSVEVDDDPEAVERADAEALAAHRAEARAVLARAQFDVYAPEGLACGVDGWGTSGEKEVPESVSVAHGRPEESSWLSVQTEREPSRPDPHDHDLLASLASLIGDTDDAWPGERSQASLTLWLDDRERRQARAVAGLACVSRTLLVDGMAQTFRIAQQGDRWVAARRHGRLTLTVVGICVALGDVHLRAVADPVVLAADEGVGRPLSADAFRPPRAARAALDPAVVTDLAGRGPLADIAAQLAALARVGLRAQELAEAPPVGASRLGGDPDLPDDVDWPLQGWADGSVQPLRFVAQIAPADLDPAIWPGPREGLLSIFHREPPMEESEAVRVLHIAAGASLAPRAWPAGHEEAVVWERPAAITFVPELALPDLAGEPPAALEPFGFGREEPRAELAEDYHELLERLADEQELGPGPRVLGWPWFVHSDTLACCVHEQRSADGGVDFDGIQDEADRWSVLLCFWEDHTVATTIALPTADLAAGRFDRVRACSQY